MPNAKTKIFPLVGLYATTVLNRPSYKQDITQMPIGDIHASIIDKVGAETRDYFAYGVDKPKHYHMNNPKRNDSILRSRKRIKEICMLNQFTYFVTLTLNDNKIDATNYADVKKHFEYWKRNQAARYNMCGLFVPELGSKHKRLHIHGLISGNMPLSDSGHRLHDGRIIYNMTGWRYGFSTCIPITGTYEHVCRYISKYITKDTIYIFPHSYSKCGNIIMYPQSFVFDTDYDAFDGIEYSVPDTSIKVKYRNDYPNEPVQ